MLEFEDDFRKELTEVFGSQLDCAADTLSIAQ